MASEQLGKTFETSCGVADSCGSCSVGSFQMLPRFQGEEDGLQGRPLTGSCEAKTTSSG